MTVDERFTPGAAAQLRRAVAAARGNEVLAVGRLDGGRRVAGISIGARGNTQAVPALEPFLERGDVLIHNHPSGLLEPSGADLQIASRLGNEGIGFYIVDNPVMRVYVVAEPVSPGQITALDAGGLAAQLEPGGGLSRLYADYEQRPSQVDMLRYVCEAFNTGQLRLAEAGTGVGKSLAYLIPACQWVLDNEERVVISTATINLQQQLVEKDIPLVCRIMGRDPGYMLVKGRGNYLCLNRLEEALEELALFVEEDEGLTAIKSWSALTPTGSRSELPFFPSDELWSRVCSEADACHGLRCPHRERCFVLKARRQAAGCRLLVANHHLLFSDLAMRLSGLGFDSAAVLPPFQRIVFDEAHNIEKSATSYFSQSFSRFQVAKYAGRLYRERKSRRSGLLLGLEKTLGQGSRFREIRRLVSALSERSGLLDLAARELLGTESALRLAPGQGDPLPFGELLQPLGELATAITVLCAALERLLGDREEEESYLIFETRLQVRRLARVADLCERLTRFRENGEEICWLQAHKDFRGEAFARFVITPLQVAPLMKEAVYEPYQTVVFTSATLTVDNRFDYWKSRLGFDLIRHRQTAEAVFPSPFDYRKRVFLGIPEEAPEPDQEGYPQFIADFVKQALLISEGRALVLFTSYTALDSCFQAVEGELARAGIPLLRQGQDERSRLLARFRESTASVLFATDSFWEGVDAPGEALEVVILTRLPFRVPTDPVLKARTEAIEASGGRAFWQLALPDAIVRLRQGFGRLMRRQDDSGAVLILDSRIVRKRYGGYFLSSLPRTTRVISSKRGVLNAFEDFLVSRRQKEKPVRS